MIREEHETNAPDEQPQDGLVDRRNFLKYAAALSMGAAATQVLAPAARAQTAAPAFSDAAYARRVRPEAVEDPTEATLAEAAALIRDGRLSPVELVEAQLDRIERFDGTYKAWNLVRAEEALARARNLAGRRPRTPLHGIPLAIKDNYYTAGVATTANSYIYQDFVPDYTATVVGRLTGIGGILLGKTQMGPLATTRATTPDGVITTTNAWAPENPAVDPGGSSSGSATAVAGRMATSSLGTQTGGSITSPSNAQALTGLKPTMGRNSLYGIVPLTYSRDHPGPLARDARDAAIMLQATAGPDPNDPRSRGLPKVPDFVAASRPRYGNAGRPRVRYPTRLGVIPGYESTPERSEMLAAFERLGVEVVDVTLPEEWDLLTGGAFNNVRLPERSEPFLEYLRQDVRLFGVSLNSWISGLFLGGEDYLKGQRAKYVLLQRVLDDLFSQCDAVVQTSPVPFDIIGLPEIAFPIGFNAAGLPVGAVIGGRPYAEQRLLALAGAYQAVTDWHLRRPPDPQEAPAGARSRDGLAGRPRLTPDEAFERSQ